MARLVQSSGYDRALLGGFVSSEYVRERMERDTANFRDSVVRARGTEYLDRFGDRSRALDMDVLANRAVAINRHSRSAFRDDMIMDVDNVTDLQHVSYRTARYLLSDTRINYNARNQRIEAWQINRDDYAYGTNEDRHDDPYYRSMNHGMMQPDDSDMIVENYICHSEDNTVEKLSYVEQRSLYRSRDVMLAILQEGGEDPSSRINNLL